MNSARATGATSATPAILWDSSSERYFRQGEIVVPDLCFNGLPGSIYTDATCLTALLLLHEHDRQCLEESCNSLLTVLNLFRCDAFKAIIHGRLFHHHHNPTLAGIMAQLGLIHACHSQVGLDRLYRRAKFMALGMMDVCYGIETRVQPEIASELRTDQDFRIQSFIEHYPIANEIQELHREVTKRL